MIKELFKEQKSLIDYFFKHIDIKQSEKMLNAFLQCKGTIVFSGVGKSGVIAEKLAMTMVSVGIKAFHLTPLNALHGDLGCLAEGDLFVCLSKSGETAELITLLSHVKERGLKTLAWVCRENSKLEKFCDLSIVLPLQKELCPFDLVPTTSTNLQLIFGDILAVAIMKEKNFTTRDFAKNHPGGTIGKKLLLKVEDIMLKGESLPLCKKEDNLSDALIELTNKRCGCILIIDENQHLLGIFTDGDLRRILLEKKEKALSHQMKDIMTSSLLFIGKDQLLLQALEMMQKTPQKWVKELPVISNEKKLVGLIRMHDIVQQGIV